MLSEWFFVTCVTCEKGDGKGSVVVECEECRGEGCATCDSNGTLRSECHECDGSGMVECDECEGKARKSSNLR